MAPDAAQVLSVLKQRFANCARTTPALRRALRCVGLHGEAILGVWLVFEGATDAAQNVISRVGLKDTHEVLSHGKHFGID